MRCTLADEIPTLRAIERTHQRVRFGGGCALRQAQLAAGSNQGIRSPNVAKKRIICKKA